MNRIRLYIISAMVFIGFLLPNNGKAQNKNNKSLLVDEYYYSGISSMYRDSLEESWNLLKFCEMLDSTNAPTYFAMAENLSMQNENDRSFTFLEKAYNLSPQNEMYALPYADILQQNGNSTRSAEILEDLIKNNPTKYNYREKLALVYLYSGNVSKAISIYDELQNINKGLSSDYERYSVAKMRIYKAVGDETNFIKELESLSKNFPGNKDYIYSLLNVMLKNKKYRDRANKIIADLNKNSETKDAALFFKVISDIENKSFDNVKKGLFDFVALKDVSMAKKAELLDYATASFIESSDTTKIKTISLPAFRQLINDNRNNQQLMLQYASTLKNAGEADSAFSTIKDAIAIDAKNPEVYEISARMFLEEKDVDRCAYIAGKAIENDIYKLEYVLWQAAPAFEAKNQEEKAIQSILSSLGKHNWLKEDRSVLLGVIGDLYSSKKDTTTAIAYYEKSLESFSDNANVANNYAYILTETNKNLQKAETLGALAVRLQPNNPNNLDTYAWALYKNKSYTLSRIHISKALENDDKEMPSFTINAHASYIYIALGDKEKALEYYNKALEINKSNPDEGNKVIIDDLKNKLKEIE